VTNACIQGTVKMSTGDPAVGVEIRVETTEFSEVLTTDEAGKWVISVTTAGEYSITLDTATLPSGQRLASTATNPATITVALHNNGGAVFKLESTSEAAGSSGTETSSTNGITWERFSQQAASGLRLGLLLALAAIGLSLIYGTTGLSNFAHAEQVTMGGLIAYGLANVLGWNLILATIATVVITAATGWTQDALIWKPLRKRGIGVNQLMIVTIGLSIALQYTFQYFVGAGTVRIQQENPEVITIGSVTLTLQSYAAMGIAIIVIVLAGLFLLKTRVGRATRAVSDNPALAAASGIDVDRIIRLVWTISAGLAGLSGVMLGLVLNGINWQTGMQLLLLLFAAVTLGGLGTAFGALAGSLIIGMVVELTNLVLPGDFKYATALVILILLLLVRPQGIFGRKERVG
jgi:branched-chain amino acid transport system permease protein